MDHDSLAAQVAVLRRGRTVLWVASAGALMGLLGAMLGKPVLSVVGWFAAFLCGLSGLSDSARALGTPAPVKYGAMLGAMVPGLNLPLLAGFAWHSQRGLAPLDEALRAQAARERRARRAAEPAEPPARRSAPPAPASPRAPSPAPSAFRAQAAGGGVRGAIACVKSVTAAETPDDWLSVRIGAGAPGQDLPAGSQPLARVCGGHFVVFYLVDEGQSFRYVNHDELAAAGLRPDDLHAIGLRNLGALVAGTPGLRTGREGAVHALLMGGHFEASLVLLDDLWDGPLAPMAPHGAVVTLPARDICAFCDARSAEGVAQLRALAQRVSAQGDHLVTQRLFQRSGGRWRAWAG